MPTVERMTTATPEQVFGALADGWYYSNWVVGASHVRAVDADWPGEGSQLHHASGGWPAVIRDRTTVEAGEVGRRLVLLASGGPIGKFRVEILLGAVPTGTKVTMHETTVSGPSKWLPKAVVDPMLVWRNKQSLARLCALAERRTAPSE